MYEFGFPNKLIALTRMCMENTEYRVRTENVSNIRSFYSGKQAKVGGRTIPSILFYLALDKVVRILQENEGGL